VITRVFSLLLLLLSLALSASAHEMRPGFLEIKETEKDTFIVTFKVPAKDSQSRLPLYTKFSEDCVVQGAPKVVYANAAFVERFTFKRPGGLSGAEVTIEGLATTYTDVLVRLENKDGVVRSYRLTPETPSVVVGDEPSASDVAETYAKLGVQHILEGYDHLLFVLCLVMIAGLTRKLLITITGFTIAHSITLALATLGFVNVPVPPVEAVIALSIVFLAREIALGDKEGLTYRHPVAVAASFGLLHGFGFASVLGQIGLPQGEIPAALLFFNVGVELGQLVFICSLAVLWLLLRPLLKKLSRPWATTFSAYCIGTAASFWLVERVAGF
jgi:hydrogenase/urease accessory protein HupE